MSALIGVRVSAALQTALAARRKPGELIPETIRRLLADHIGNGELARVNPRGYPRGRKRERVNRR